jgi:hypothetical protein
VWDAIATGPGIDSWFFGRTTIEPGVGGRAAWDMGGHVEHSTVTTWEPGKRFVYRGDEAEDGSFMAFEYLIEGRDGGSTVLRFVHNGLLSGDDWEGQYDGLRDGDAMYLRKLGTYVEHFAGRASRQNVFLIGPQVPDRDQLWAAFTGAMGVTGSVTEGEPVRLAIGDEPVDGTVAFVRTPLWVGVRTADGMYSLMHGYQSVVVLEYSGFAEDRDEQKIESGMRSWLATTFA